MQLQVVIIIHTGLGSGLSLLYGREIVLYSGRYDFPSAATHELVLSVYNFHLCSFCNEKCTEVQLARKYSSRGKCTFLSAKKWFDLRKFMIPIVEFLQICLFSFTLFLGFFTVGFTNF